MKTIISDRQWHSSPTLNYSIKYETERPNVYDATVRVRFKITMRSLYSSCNFKYPLYIKISINNKEYFWQIVQKSFFFLDTFHKKLIVYS